jgi:hypothetical protein
MICKNCGQQSEGRHCPGCGQPLETHRITFSHLIHEVTHLFTHLDKGFLYTLKMLIIQPGQMQRLYLEGHRVKHQKPFSMFFICASILAVAIYWFTKNQQPTEQIAEAHNKFLKSYYVLMHILLLPFYTFVTWLLFKRSHYNYAETGVLTMYTGSFMFLLLILTNSLNILAPRFASITVEVILLAVYNIWTFVNFFNKTSYWIVIPLSIANLVINYFVFKQLTDWLVMEVIVK